MNTASKASTRMATERKMPASPSTFASGRHFRDTELVNNQMPPMSIVTPVMATANLPDTLSAAAVPTTGPIKPVALSRVESSA